MLRTPRIGASCKSLNRLSGAQLRLSWWYAPGLRSGFAPLLLIDETHHDETGKKEEAQRENRYAQTEQARQDSKGEGTDDRSQLAKQAPQTFI